jgi:hypothetical protein
MRVTVACLPRLAPGSGRDTYSAAARTPHLPHAAVDASPRRTAHHRTTVIVPQRGDHDIGPHRRTSLTPPEAARHATMNAVTATAATLEATLEQMKVVEDMRRTLRDIRNVNKLDSGVDVMPGGQDARHGGWCRFHQRPDSPSATGRRPRREVRLYFVSPTSARAYRRVA